MNWKVQRDPYYSGVFERGGEAALTEAGYFDTTAESADDINYMLNIPCTPLDKVILGLQMEFNPCVLVMPGSFCPPHQGHIEAMNAAKAEVEKAGYKVIGGYLSPGHDEYISAKNGQGAIPAHHRIKLCNDITRNTWIDTCPWEGLFAKVAVNFTDVVERLRLYIKRHTGTDVPVFFVTGGDKANYCMAFEHQGHCVVVNRPEKDGDRHRLFLYYWTKFYKNQGGDDRILFADLNNNTSSTKIRETFSYKPKKVSLHLRVEMIDLYKSIHIRNAMINTLSSRYDSVETKTEDDQQQDILKLRNVMKPLVSLDSLVKGDYNLRVSRYYDFFGDRMLHFGTAPGAAPLKEQMSAIDADHVYLYDDDIHTTGGTIRYMTKLLASAGINVRGVFTFKVSDNMDGEILDLRDFLIGKNDCGLVVSLPNGKASRAPYMYPYVCPHARASVNDPMELSIEMWEHNAHMHRNTRMTVADLGEMSELFLYAGFEPRMSVYDLCQHHVELLIKLIR